MNNTLINFLVKKAHFNECKISNIEKLGGLSSDNYKVIYDSNTYFVKQCYKTYLHTNRHNEIKVINSAANLHLCNKPIYYSTETGNMISPWIFGNIPTEKDYKNIIFIKNLTVSLKKLHNLKCDNYFNPFEHIKSRIEIAKDKKLPLPYYIDTLIDKLNNLELKLIPQLSLGLCHNDLNCSNIIINNNNINFVDFEYAAMGDIFYDLANISWFLDESLKKELLICYFGEYKKEHYKKLNYYLFIVKLYNATWSLLKSTDSHCDYDYLAGANLIFEDLNENY